MKKLLVVLAAGLLMAGTANAGNFAVQGGFVNTGLGGGIKVNIAPGMAVEANVGIPYGTSFGGYTWTYFPVGGGLLFDITSMLDGKLAVYGGAQGVFILTFTNVPGVTIPPVWTATGKVGIEFYAMNQLSLFAGVCGGVGGVVTTGPFTGSTISVIVPAFGGEAGVRYYLF